MQTNYMFVVHSLTCLLLHALGLINSNLIIGMKCKLHFSLFPPQKKVSMSNMHRHAQFRDMARLGQSLDVTVA